MYCNLMIWGCFFKMANTHVLFFVKMDFSLLCLLFSFLVFLILLIALYILRNMFYFLYVLHDEKNDNFHFIISLITQSPGNMFYRCFSFVLIVRVILKKNMSSILQFFVLCCKSYTCIISYMRLLDGNEISCVFLGSTIYTLFMCDCFLK